MPPKAKKPRAKKMAEQVVAIGELEIPAPAGGLSEPPKAAIGPSGMDLPRVPGPGGYQGVTFGGKQTEGEW